MKPLKGAGKIAKGVYYILRSLGPDHPDGPYNPLAQKSPGDMHAGVQMIKDGVKDFKAGDEQ